MGSSDRRKTAEVGRQVMHENADRQENRKLESEISYQALHESTSLMIKIEVQEKLNIKYISPNVHDVLGYALEDFESNRITLEDIVHLEDMPRLMMRCACFTPSKNKPLEYRLVTSDGKVHWVEERVTVQQDQKGNIISYQGILLDINHRKILEEKYKHMAYFDKLTGLYNHTQTLEKLKSTIAATYQGEYQLAIIFFGIERFSLVNSTYGREIGDTLLQGVAERIGKYTIKREEFAGRIYADKFLVAVLRENEAELEQVIMSIWADINDYLQEYSIRLNVGYTIYEPLNQEVQDIEQLITQAEMAKHEAKHYREGFPTLYSQEIGFKMVKRAAVGTDLINGINRQEFKIVYQPIVHATSKEMVYVEALIRWDHPVYGRLSPHEFIPIAEDTGLIIPLEKWLFKEIFKQLKSWQAAGVPHLGISINISSAQFNNEYFIDELEELRDLYGCSPEYIQLEITESTLIRDLSKTRDIMTKLKEKGYKLAIDDFAIAHSSLHYIKNLVVDTIKIDRSFVMHIHEDKQSYEIVKSLVSLAQNLDLTVIVEGVEVIEQVKVLEALACDHLQGYFFSRPVPENEIVEIYRIHQLI